MYRAYTVLHSYKTQDPLLTRLFLADYFDILKSSTR